MLIRTLSLERKEAAAVGTAIQVPGALVGMAASQAAAAVALERVPQAVRPAAAVAAVKSESTGGKEPTCAQQSLKTA
jgi:hypothetical protein